jgi:hypothetical protein
VQAHFDTCGDVEAVAQIRFALWFELRPEALVSLPNVGAYDAVRLLSGWNNQSDPREPTRIGLILCVVYEWIQKALSANCCPFHQLVPPLP